MNRLALFDCDGTLVDSGVAICLAMEEAFARFGLPAPERGEIRRVVGLSLVEAAAALLPHADDAVHRTIAADYRHAFQCLRAAGRVEEPLFPGILALLDRLDGEGWLLGIATGKSDRGLANCLVRHGIERRFVTLQTADRHPSKPDPAMAEAAITEAGAAPGTTVVIGDTSYDMAMARAAGARAIGVGWGYHGAAELHSAGADAVIESPAALFEHLSVLAR